MSVFEIAFPDGDHGPAEAAEVAGFAGVAFGVAVKFSSPEGGVVLRKRVVTFRATMPEAAVHKYRDLFADE